MDNLLQVLLDENLPTKLKYRFNSPFLFVSTIRDQNWLGKKNGELLRLMQENSFSVLITNDKSIRYQQNTHLLPVYIVQLNAPSNRYDDILPLISQIQDKLLNVRDIIRAKGHPNTLTMIDL